MKISQITINHMKEPIGFEFKNLRINFKIEANKYENVKKQLVIWIDDENNPEYKTEFENYTNNHFSIDLNSFKLKPRTRYTVQVNIQKEDNTIVSEKTFFETGKINEQFVANWITNENKDIQNTLFKLDHNIEKKVTKARLYITALGVYETYIDNKKVGNEFLAPGVTAYDKLVQVQTYDVTDLLTSGKHQFIISTADGWYKGNMGFDGGINEIYGNQHRAIAEYHIEYEDGTSEVVLTDEKWKTTAGKVTKSSIYYGEDLDDTYEVKDWKDVVIGDYSKDVLTDRLSLPLSEQEKLDVKEIINTPNGEQVLDFAQNQVGWLEFYNREPKGTKITFQMGEILQEGNFYRENLRHARAAFEYISDGEEKWVRPHFTYYGYRYVKVEGNTKPLNKEDFKAVVIYSEMEETGNICTQNPKVNRLFDNVIWGQKSNFFDVPTDCPQRDERLGWTGDANVFSNTAIFNMNVYPFFRKWLKDVTVEQEAFNGRVPHYAPAMGNKDGGAAVWGDATTFVPWNIYQAYGDEDILKEHYESMKSWVDWIGSVTKTPNLWTGCFQFGDWLALDGENPALPTGRTDENYVASVFYHYSALIVAKSAEILGKTEDAKKYNELAKNIKESVKNEFITATGRLSIDTQTGYALALEYSLVPKELENRVFDDLVNRLKKDDNHLKTGFVGTPYINQILSRYGRHDLATKIFLHEDYPSWLYAVNLGATTVWERWNSVEPDGSMNPEGMNSLNHYSIGAIMEWGYKYVLGLREQKEGYKEVTFAPEFDNLLNKVNGYYDTNYGVIKVDYEVESDDNHTIKIKLDIPFGMNVNVNLPRSKNVDVKVNDKVIKVGKFELNTGHYDISYIPTMDYVERYNAETPIAAVMNDSLLIEKIDEIDGEVLDFFRKNPEALFGGLGKMSITKFNHLMPFANVSQENIEKIEAVLANTAIISQRK